MAEGNLRHVFRGPCGDDLSAAAAAFGTQVDDPVGTFDDVQIVLDDQYGVALIDQPLQDIHQPTNVVEVQSRGRFVQQIERLARVDPRQLRGQLDALGLAAGERRGGLTEGQIAQSDSIEAVQRRGRSPAKFSKKSAASSMLILSTSAIEWPR